MKLDWIEHIFTCFLIQSTNVIEKHISGLDVA